jgi:hypothetical protein
MEKFVNIYSGKFSDLAISDPDGYELKVGDYSSIGIIERIEDAKQMQLGPESFTENEMSVDGNNEVTFK